MSTIERAHEVEDELSKIRDTLKIDISQPIPAHLSKLSVHVEKMRAEKEQMIKKLRGEIPFAVDYSSGKPVELFITYNKEVKL